MQVVWEADTPDFHKRKRAARACLSCQKRKKRCRHTFQGATVDYQVDTHHHEPETGGITGEVPAPYQSEVIRFVGDTNPESVLTDLSNRPVGAARPHRLGTWIEPPATEDNETVTAVSEAEAATQTQDQTSPMASGRSNARLNIHQERYLRDIGAFLVLPQQTQDVLIAVYFSCIDPILPLFDDGNFLQEFRSGSASNFLINAICLVACKTEDATNFLRLTQDGPLLPPLAFARAIYIGLSAAMKAELERDRVDNLQILALLSLHNDGLGGIEESSLHLHEAIHRAHTAALQVHNSGERPEGHPRLLYWCLWSLDKINAALAGRPVGIADRDIGIARPTLDSEPVFHGFIMWLRLSDLLAKVIGFYRPMANQDDPGWEDGFPPFEEVIDSQVFQSLLKSHQDILELYYNAVAILACRAGDSSTISYQRRAKAALRIQAITTARDTELHLPPLPLVPYAVSLSLTVAYRLWRDSRSAIDQGNAQADLTTRCEVLEKLGARWTSAAAMAKLGRKALKSLERPTAEDSSKLSGMMEDAITPCKPLAALSRGVGEDNTATKQTGLDVLSSAAEAHASSVDNRRPSDTVIADSMYENNSANGMVGNLPTFQDFGLQDGHFQDLDALFGDFVDLSMPTLFQDPLFENDQFFDLADF